MTKFVETRCRICKSPHRKTYEDLHLKEKKSLKDLEKISAELEPKKITSMSFSIHFRKHVEAVLDELLKTDLDRRTQLEERVGEALDIVSDLQKYLRALDDAIKPYIEKKEKLKLSELSALNTTIRNIRETLKLLSDMTHQLRIQTGSKNEGAVLMNVIKRLDPQTARKIFDAMRLEGML